MAGKFEIKSCEGQKFNFCLKAGNGEIILISQQYATLAACKKGIDSVKRNAIAAKLEDQTVEGSEKPTNPRFEIYNDAKGEFRFRLRARNGEIIATGEGYKAKASCLKGVESIRKNAPDAETVTIE